MIKIKENIYKVLLSVSVVALAILWILFLNTTQILNSNKEGLKKIEFIGSSIQRISKLELEYTIDDALMLELDVMFKLLYIDGIDVDGSLKYFNDSDEIKNTIKLYLDNCINFRAVIENFRVNDERHTLFSDSEENYRLLSNTTQSAIEYINQYSNKVDNIKVAMSINVIIIGLILVRMLVNTHNELQNSKEISKNMQIDTSSGLYNRKMCQDIINTPISNDENERAVVIFSLNDLKQTYDTLGKKDSDELITLFIEQIQNATKIFTFNIFVGQYSEDKFMVFFEFTDEQNVNRYIEEVDYLMKDFNQKQNNAHKLSWSTGYAITTKDTKDLTVKELFDIADDNMYKNKLAMK